MYNFRVEREADGCYEIHVEILRLIDYCTCNLYIQMSYRRDLFEIKYSISLFVVNSVLNSPRISTISASKVFVDMKWQLYLQYWI